MTQPRHSSWDNGVTHDHGYDRYDEGPYDSCPPQLEILTEYDWAGDYEFDMIVVWRHRETGELRAAADSGCSCPTPFAGLTWDEMKPIRSVEDLRELFEVEPPYGVEWDGQDPGVADLKAAVHRALRG